MKLLTILKKNYISFAKKAADIQISELKKIKKIFRKNKTTFCYCISEYPTKMSKINWNQAKNYSGFSDHTLGITAPIVFSLIKKQMKTKEIFIEKHVKLKESEKAQCFEYFLKSFLLILYSFSNS